MNERRRKQENAHVPYCEKKKKKIECSDVINVSINECYRKENFMKSLSDAFLMRRGIKFDNGAKLLSNPFPCCVLPDFLNSEEYLVHLKEELSQIKLHKKLNDLFEFKQSEDLGSASFAHVKILRKILYEDCLPWMREVTKIPLINTVDMTCSLYSNTDVLLCHDDELEGRRIAFILYLVPKWEVEDGGSLDLFSAENGQPTDIVTSLFPVWNNFIFFEVSPISFHQVAEVLSDKLRLSVSGWYHGPPQDCQRKSVMEPRLLGYPVSYEGDIKQWINPNYLDPSVQIEIRQLFKQNSETALPDFLQYEKYCEVADALNECKTGWKLVGPANKRRYEELNIMPEIVKECIQVFQSEAMCLILSNLTGLAFHKMAVIDSSDSSCDDSSDESSINEYEATSSCHYGSVPAVNSKAEIPQNISHSCQVLSSVRKWKHGYYTLLHDETWSKKGLNANIYFNCEGWKSECGGYTAYIAEGDVTELLRVVPECNNLALVYTDAKTTNFVKYINNKVFRKGHPSFFYDVDVTYFEQVK